MDDRRSTMRHHPAPAPPPPDRPPPNPPNPPPKPPPPKPPPPPNGPTPLFHPLHGPPPQRRRPPPSRGRLPMLLSTIKTMMMRMINPGEIGKPPQESRGSIGTAGSSLSVTPRP